MDAGTSMLAAGSIAGDRAAAAAAPAAGHDAIPEGRSCGVLGCAVALPESGCEGPEDVGIDDMGDGGGGEWEWERGGEKVFSASTADGRRL